MGDKWTIGARLAEQNYLDRQKREARQKELKTNIIQLLIQHKQNHNLSAANSMTADQIKDALRPIREFTGSASRQTVSLRNLFRSAWGEPKSIDEINYILSNRPTSEQEPRS